MKRRKALSRIVIGGATVFILPLTLSSCEKNDPDPDNGSNNNDDSGPLTIDLSQSANSDLNNDGGYVIKGNIIIINADGTFIALSSVCTHNSCTVSYSAANDNLPCPCHGSIFSTTGSVIQGPANSPLKQYTVSREGDILTIS